MASKSPHLYQTLPSSPGSIRLLRVQPPQEDNVIRCELTVGNVNTSEYYALSYVWGPPDETFPIQVNGDPWSIRKTLLSFLRNAQRDYIDQPFWIDALCINQDDIPERNQQVAQMSQIYSQATLVLVWLENDLSSYELFSGISNAGNWIRPLSAVENDTDKDSMNESLGDSYQRRWGGWEDPDELVPEVSYLTEDDINSFGPLGLSERLRKTVRTIFTEIGQHPYWTRSWVVQEFCLAKDIVFVFQSMEIAFWRFECAFLLTESDLDIPKDSFGAIDELIIWRQQVYQAMSDYQTVSKESRKDRLSDMEHLLFRFGSRQCQDVRDRVFSLVGMCKEAQKLKVDYSQNKLQLFLAVLQCLNTGQDRYLITARLVELLDLSLSDITLGLSNLPVLDHTFGHEGDFLVVNGTGNIAEIRQIWLCQCSQCHGMEKLFQPNEQVVVVSTGLTSLWLLYSSKKCKISDAALPGRLETHFDFVACASPVEIDHRGKQNLCAFIPEHPLLNLFHESQFSLENDDHRNTMKLHLNERSVFAHAFCSSSRGSASAPAVAHSSLTMPVAGSDRDHGLLGALHFKGDWSRPALVDQMAE